MSSKQVTIEVDGPGNESLYFRPLQRRLRGRFDYARDSEPQSKLAASNFTAPIPGLRLAFDFATNTATLVDPLHDSEHESLREQLIAKGHRLGPERETFENQDAVTWCFWMQRAVEAGTARILEGEFPKLKGEPRKDFLNARLQTTGERLADAIDRQNALFEKLLTRLA